MCANESVVCEKQKKDRPRGLRSKENKKRTVREKKRARARRQVREREREREKGRERDRERGVVRIEQDVGVFFKRKARDE